MPFGAIYGALFFVLVSIAMTFSGAPAGDATGAARACFALLALALAWGLLRRRSWARWGGVAACATLVALGSGSLLLLFGAVLAAVLLIVPATGDVVRGAETTRGSLADRLAATVSTVAGAGFLVALAYGGVGSAGGASAEVVLPERLAGSPSWSDFDNGLERARAEGKPILINFVTDWCGFCRKMDRTTWKHPTVVERLGELVAVRVDAEDGRRGKEFSGRELAARYGVTGYPTIMLLDEGGAVIARTGGYQQPRQLLAWLEKGLAP